MSRLEDLVERDRHHDCDGFGAPRICVKIEAVAQLPTRFGSFQIVAFWNNRDGKEHLALVHGDVLGAEEVVTRLHSECLTGDALGSLRCDCRDQLELALQRLSVEPRGVLLYLRQEGRGIGLLNKVRAYALQDRGLDTVDANLALGFRDDERDYAVAAHMLASLTIRSVRLLTNNPKKVQALEQLGIHVSGRIPHVIAPNEHNRLYLETKARRSGHFIDTEKAFAQARPDCEYPRCSIETLKTRQRAAKTADMTSASFSFRRALTSDAAELSRLAQRAKAHWGYPAEWLSAWEAELTIEPSYLALHRVLVAESAGQIAGMCALEDRGTRWALEHVWVDPQSMGQGVGRALVLQALTLARAVRPGRIVAEADPNAAGFYRQVGAREIGVVPAPMPGAPGRVMPVFSFEDLEIA